MSDLADLEAFRGAWVTQRDILTGRRYIDALEASGEYSRALEVCDEMWGLGFPSGRVDAAWIVKDRGDVERAITLMTEALPLQDEDDLPLLHGIIGHWRWHYLNDPRAETQLLAGMLAYGTARADLGHLMIATGRPAEGRRVLQEGADEDTVECMVPLANLLSHDGDRDGAEAMYRRAIALGDAHSAWNLASDLLEEGRDSEAEELQWLAASMGDEVAIAYLSSQHPDL